MRLPWYRRRRHVLTLLLVLCLVIRNFRVTTAKEEPDQAERDAKRTVSETILIRRITTTKSNDDGQEDSIDEQEIRDFNDLADPNRLDPIEDSMLDPLASDPSCLDEGGNNEDCWQPPKSTIETEVKIDATCSYGGDDPSEEQVCTTTEVEVDKHWGSDARILKIRDQLRHAGSGSSATASGDNKRPPIFLLPGLASTRLVAWRHKECPHVLHSDIKIQDYVWLNINLIIQMASINVECMKECLKLGLNQSDTDDLSIGCKLRPDEGLDAISSLAPGGLGSKFLVGGTNTVYAWLIQWLADNLGYDVGNIIGLPYDWRLSPDKMEERDGFLTLTRRRIEAAVKSNGQPGIMVAHSMGNTIFRYFCEWLRQEMRDEAYQKYIKQAERRAKARTRQHAQPTATSSGAPDDASNTNRGGWMSSGPFAGLDEWWNAYFPAGENDSPESDESIEMKQKQLLELAQMEGDENYYEWLEQHIWTYVGLSAPALGAVNPLRSVISGENMGLPITDEAAREMEVTFGCTHSVNPISSKMAFCDQWEPKKWDDESTDNDSNPQKDLFCLDDLMNEIENSRPNEDPWADFPVLKNLLKDRADWDSAAPMMSIIQETCGAKEKPPCANRTTTNISPRDAQTGNIFHVFDRIWKEENAPLLIKREQLSQSWWETNVPNILNKTWDRPHIKHVIMAYGVDLPTELAYVYKKSIRQQPQAADDNNSKDNDSTSEPHYDGVPNLERVIWEEANGKLVAEHLEHRSLTDTLVRRKAKREPLPNPNVQLQHSGDGTVPYLSLSWAHTWLLHAIRAQRYSSSTQQNGDSSKNALEDIHVSHRPKGAMEWVEGPPPVDNIEIVDSTKATSSSNDKDDNDDDTGTTHPHGTKYKPAMIRFHNVGTSRKTGMKYSTTVIEASEIEHKETTRNWDILAAVFTDVLREMHNDFEIVNEQDTNSNR